MKIVYVGKNEESYNVLNEVASLSDSTVIFINSIQESIDFLTKNKDIHGVIAEAKIDNIPSLQIKAFMKKDEMLKDIPFIILAENVSKEDIEYYKAMGAEEVFEIPFNPLEIYLIITAKLKDVKGEDVVKQILHEAKKDKSIFMKILEFIKKLFGKA